ncbi:MULTISPECIES: helix-turn-helix domain-containing protein [Pseudomonas]|uniref:helix-turn-helix domain-containing protein n=1 Tax=Pseudomonas TaxID=286 RepID=UPI000C2431E1|nr:MULTISPECIES: helix-turn-helix transcriptional regulator [Pseudomonas]MBJ2223192.1 helix-turn-helix transcriptional regulator [Pseudomonas sp. MF7451]MCI0912989.1 helix-turn-helix transcriptional regulator [Pseudomonas putida]MBW9240714.1 helix-turn-helix transcriptional regulator [Pseudomonas carnis]PJI75520.1 transcriptional regulator [Pseudomonas sp. MR 02]URD42535.1 helix-turn-helix domain-containing protein [Pseudomonas sp. BYT-5]
MELKSAFGRILQWMRVKQKLTQEDFATVSSRTYISTLERGRYVPTIQKLDTIAPVLGVHPVTLMIGSYALKENRSARDLLAQVAQEAEHMDLEAALSALSKSSRSIP